MRLAVAASVAAYPGFDQARAVRLGKRVAIVAGVAGERHWTGDRFVRPRLTEMPGYRLAHERTQRVFVHETS